MWNFGMKRPRMKYEKPQKGNPHGLTVKQHAFPVVSISRFAQSDGCVSVYLIKQRKEIRLKADDQLFCAKRIWNQGAESGFMKEIEDKYQALAEAVISGGIQTINNEVQSVITDMFAIWNIRVHIQASNINDQKIDVIGVRKQFTKDEQEILEKNNIGFIKPDLTIPSREISAYLIKNNLSEIRNKLSNAQWGILRAREEQFIVPDKSSIVSMLPVSPTICFNLDSNDDVISRKEVAEINSLAIASSNEYYFANDLSKCPLVPKLKLRN